MSLRCRHLLASLGQSISIVVFCAGFLLVPFVHPNAHELRPAIVDLTFDPPSTVSAEISLNLEAFMLGISGEHNNTRNAPESDAYDALRAMDAPALEAEFRAEAGRLLADLGLVVGSEFVPFALHDVEISAAMVTLPRVSRLSLTAALPEATDSVVWRGGDTLGDLVLRASVEDAAEPYYSRFVQVGTEQEPIPLDRVQTQSGWTSFISYIPVGFDHILPKGLDHILFVVGLFLLSTQVRPLLAQVTMFTLAHSVTLALGLYGVIRISPSIVEPLIAASIVFIAVENLCTENLSRFRPFVIFGFGLLHGLGFAGVLTDFGLPDGHELPALIGFNLGVELGQLAVLALCFLSVGFWFWHRDWYRRFVAMPASLSVAMIGMVWVFERIS